MGVDEKVCRRSHNYVTLFADLGGARLVYATEGRSAGVLGEFREDLEAHGGSGAQIEELCMDMSPAYLKGARESFPEAEVTYDRFHVVKLLNEAVDAVRRREQKQRPELKRTRWMWLWNPERLRPWLRGELAGLGGEGARPRVPHHGELHRRRLPCLRQAGFQASHMKQRGGTNARFGGVDNGFLVGAEGPAWGAGRAARASLGWTELSTPCRRALRSVTARGLGGRRGRKGPGCRCPDGSQFALGLPARTAVVRGATCAALASFGHGCRLWRSRPTPAGTGVRATVPAGEFMTRSCTGRNRSRRSGRRGVSVWPWSVPRWRGVQPTGLHHLVVEPKRSTHYLVLTLRAVASSWLDPLTYRPRRRMLFPWVSAPLMSKAEVK